MSTTTPGIDTTASSPDRQRALWGDRGVRTKILTAVGVAGVVAAGVGVTGLAALGDSAAATHDLYASNLQGVSAVGDMNVVIGQGRTTTRDALSTPDPAQSIRRS